MSETFKKATKVIEKFGGIRPMAQKLDVPVTTVQGWKKRNNIPENRADDIIKAAKEHNINLDSLIASNANANEKAATSQASAPSSNAPKSGVSATSSASQQDSMECVYEGKEAVEFARQMHTKNMKNGLLGGTAIVISLIALAGVYLVSPSNAPSSNALAKFEQQLDQTQLVVNQQNENFSERISALEAGRIQLSDMIDNRLGEVQSQSVNVDTALFDRLQEQIEGLRLRMADNASMADAYNELSQSVTNIQTRLGSIEQGLSAARQSLQQSDISGADLKAATLMVSLGYLRMVLNRAEPFAADYALMRQWVGAQNDPELAQALDRLAPYATEGVLSSDQLKSSLLGMAEEVIAASLNGEDVSISDKITAQLNQLVSIKKDGVPVSGTAADDKLQQAVSYLDSNQVAGAVATLNTLDPDVRQVLAPWFSQANGTLAAQNAYTTLSDRLFTLIQNPIGNQPSSLNEANR